LAIYTLPTKELELKDLFVPGTAANPGNFSVFRLTDTALEIYFSEYQVAP